MNLSEKEDFARSMAFKSIMTVGDSQVDVKSSIGWSYSSNPDGYLFVDFVYPTGTVVRARLDDRNDFYRFLLQIELFIDNTEVSMPNINKFIKKIEQQYKCVKPEDAPKVLYATPDPKDKYDNDDEDED